MQRSLTPCRKCSKHEVISFPPRTHTRQQPIPMAVSTPQSAQIAEILELFTTNSTMFSCPRDWKHLNNSLTLAAPLRAAPRSWQMSKITSPAERHTGVSDSTNSSCTSGTDTSKICSFLTVGGPSSPQAETVGRDAVHHTFPSFQLQFFLQLFLGLPETTPVSRSKSSAHRPQNLATASLRPSRSLTLARRC